MSAARVGVLGGTFDPIHNGHIAAGTAARTALALDRLLVVPSNAPPHRADSPRASGYHRLQMVRLGVAELPGWTASDVELARGGRSYTIDTLMALRTGEPASQFFFITGADAFAEVASWRRYPEVLDLAHFVVITRPGSSFDALRAGLPELRERFVECGAAPCRDGSAMAIFLVHADTPPISSTEIRRRACAGEPLDGLVPDPVRAYITEHRLYA